MVRLNFIPLFSHPILNYDYDSKNRAGELLVAIPPDERRRAASFMHSTPARPSHAPRTSLSFSEAETDPAGSIIDAEADEEEADLLEVAKTYFAMKELDRAGHLLRGCKGPKARFLSIYCRFLVGLFFGPVGADED